jgi:hypothetical protein
MTDNERAAVRDMLIDAHLAADKVIQRAKADANLDGRLVAIATTELDKAFAVLRMAVEKAA